MTGLMKSYDETQALVESARNGNRRAFDDLVGRFRVRLRSSVEGWSRFQLGPALDVEEILQETLVAAFQSLPRFEWQGEDSFLLWLCGIAKRVVLKSTREALKKRGSRLSADVPAGGVSPSKVLRRNERFDRLQESLESLSPEYREAIQLARLEGLKIQEIAKRMKRSPNAVKHLIARGLKELRKQFGDTESFHLPARNLETEGQDHADR